jgi:hypothetical protein
VRRYIYRPDSAEQDKMPGSVPGILLSVFGIRSEDKLRKAESLPESLREFLLPQPSVDLRQQWILAGLAANAQIRAIGFCESRTLQAFAHTSLIVINGR